MANNNTSTLEFIYAIQSVNLRNVKIGFSTDVNQRLAGMQTGSPDELKVIGCWPGTQAEEQLIHGQMSQWRLHREWFFPSPEVLSLIGERNRAVKAEISGKLRIDLADGRSVEIWETCRDDQRNRYKITNSYRAAVDIKSKAAQLASSLPPHYAVIADEIVAAAQVVFDELNRPLTRPRQHQEVSPADRHCFEIKCDQSFIYSAGSKTHAIKLWMTDYYLKGENPNDVTISCLPDDQSMVMSHHNGQEIPPITKTHKEWAESAEGFIATRIETERPLLKRHAFMIQSCSDYIYSAETKRQALQLWLKDYWPSDDGKASAVSVTQLPDDNTFSFQSGDGEPKTITTKTHREWADEKEGFLGCYLKTKPFDCPQLYDIQTANNELTTEIAAKGQRIAEWTAYADYLQQPRRLTWRERINGKTKAIG